MVLTVSRRDILRAAVAAASLATTPIPGKRRSSSPPPTRLRMSHGHTAERLDVAVSEELPPDAAAAVRRFFRDFHAPGGPELDVSPRLLVALADVQQQAGGRQLCLWSGYRTPATNAHLRGTAPQSTHCIGLAADISIPDLPDAALFELAERVAGARGLGLGTYPAEHFAHLDAGRPRRWTGGSVG